MSKIEESVICSRSDAQPAGIISKRLFRKLLGAAGALTLVPSTAFCAYPAFGPIQTTNIYGSFVASGDFNGDSKDDIAVLGAVSNAVTVLLSNGDGTFGSPASYLTGSVPNVVIVADFNGDNVPDLAVSNPGSANIAVLLGKGDGTFMPRKLISGVAGSGLAAADLGRGKMDLVVAGTGVGIAVLPGQGDGTFGTPVPYSVTGAGTIAIGSLKHDGIKDLIVGTSNGEAVLIGNGDGAFQSAVYYPNSAPQQQGFVAVGLGDFDGDGNMDIAATQFGGNSSIHLINVLYGNGDGTVQLAAPYVTVAYPQALFVADFSGTGKLDIAVHGSQGSGGEVGILFGNGAGIFSTSVSYDALSLSTSFTIGDFNGDGAPDVAALSASFSNTRVMLNLTEIFSNGFE